MRKNRKPLPKIKFPKQVKNVRKVNFSFLDLHEEFVKIGKMSSEGLCFTDAAEPRMPGNRLTRAEKNGEETISNVLRVFGPTERQKNDKELFPEGWRTSYWGRGMNDDKFNELAREFRSKRKLTNVYGYDDIYTPLRQNIVLLMAAWNNEL